MDLQLPAQPQPPPAQLAELVQSLEQATQFAKQLPSASDPSHLHLIFSALHSAQLTLSSFLSLHHHNNLPPTFSSLPNNSDTCSTVGDNGGGDDKQNSNNPSIDGVEKLMKDFNIQNKRPKRPISPSTAAVAELRRIGDSEVEGSLDFDPHITMLRSLDLVYKFRC